MRKKISDLINQAASPLKSGSIPEAVEAGVKGGGRGTAIVGAGVAYVSSRVAGHLLRRAESVEEAVVALLEKSASLKERQKLTRAAGCTARVLTQGLGGAVHVGTAAGLAVYMLGRGVAGSSGFVGSTVGGLSSGVADFMTGTVDSLVLKESDIAFIRARLVQLGEGEHRAALARMKKVQAAIRAGRRDRLLDQLTVGGMTLGSILASDQVDPAIERAFAMAYPGQAASGITFADAVAAQSNEGLVGLLAGVKGKLFELQLLDHLNAGNLPEGLEARLAESATQAGWDIQIVDKQTGVVHELLQAKASDSVTYVQQAPDKYPDIDVVSTTELHAVLTARGLAEQVRDGGVLNADLEQTLAEAASAGQPIGIADFVPSSLGLAFITLSVLLSSRHLSAREMGQELGSRSSKAVAATFAGHTAMVLTQTWWLALLSGVGSGILANKGRDKRLKLDALLEALTIMEAKAATQSRHNATDIDLPALAG